MNRRIRRLDLAGIAALITAIVGVCVWLGIDPKNNREDRSAQKPITSQNPKLPTPLNSEYPEQSIPLEPTSVPSPSTPPLVFPKKTKITVELEKLYEDMGRNSLQARDVYNGVKAEINGFVLTDSIYKCHVRSEETRCINFYPKPIPINNFYVQSLNFNPKDIEQAENINRLLFDVKKPLKITIQGTLSFNESNWFHIVDWHIINYQPYEDSQR